MDKFKIPYGADFSPNKIDIIKILETAESFEGNGTRAFVNEINNLYFNNIAIANNCKNSMVAYKILETGGGIKLTDFGKKLNMLKDAEKIYDAMAKMILSELNGLLLVEAIDTLITGGESPTLERITSTLNMMGCEPLSKTNKHIPTMKKWLEKAGVLDGWNVKEKKIEALLEIEKEEIEVLKGLTAEQICFLKTLSNIDSNNYLSSADVRNLATLTYNIDFPGKNFSAAIINPLTDKGLIDKEPSKSKHGGNAPKVKIVDSIKKEILSPIMEQIENIAGNEVVKYCQKSLPELRIEIDSTDTHKKGLALEAFAIKIMQIINLDFAGTRVKGNETGGAEIDALFDTTRLNYSRWQVQCKNTAKVSLDQVAKEVGLSHVLKTNVIVILTTGKVVRPAKDYANTIMREMNLCIIFIEGEDVEEILEDPTSFVGILNRQAHKTKDIKVLSIKDID